MKITTLTTPFTPKLRPSQNSYINTTGDSTKPESTLIVPKDSTSVVKDAEGVEYLVVRDPENPQQSLEIPKEAFQEVDESYYLPTYKPSLTGGLISGVGQGAGLLGPLGVIPGAAAGLAGTFTPGSQAARITSGTAAGALALTAAHAVLFGHQGIAAAALAGGTIGLTASANAQGQAQLRDAAIGGGIVSGVASAMTGNKQFLLTGPAASALGGLVNNKLGQVAVGAAAGAAFQAALTSTTGGNLAFNTGVGALAGALGSQVGQVSMQTVRNTTQTVVKNLGPKMKKLPKPVLHGLAAAPYAIAGSSIAGIGAALVGLPPAISSAVGGIIGEATGVAINLHNLASANK